MRTVRLAFYFGFLTISATFGNCFSNGSLVVMNCIESEKQALLQFKQDLNDPSNRLSSWVEAKDCCQWNGIVCDNLTSHVHEIHLRNPIAGVGAEGYFRYQLGGKINLSLVNLKELHHLDLGGNNFERIPIPSFIGSLGSLRYLNLSEAGFAGSIPHQLGNLSMLQYLDLGGYYQYLTADNLQWLSGLSSLQHLDMSQVDLSNASDWMQVTNMLPSLVELHLFRCRLSSNIPRETNFNSSSLAVLDISVNPLSPLIGWWLSSLSSLASLKMRSCNFVGSVQNMNFLSALQNSTNLKHLDVGFSPLNNTIPNWLFGFYRLEFLDLAYTNLKGEIPIAIGNLTSLVTLDLSINQMEGDIPSSLGKLCNLRNLVLSANSLNGGEVSEVLKLFSGCNSYKLQRLELSRSQLSGLLPDELGQFRNLAYLYLYDNSISGTIPESIGRLSSLIGLDISNNKLNGTLPVSFGQLRRLERLELSSNSLTGALSEAHFVNLKRLIRLDLRDNKFTLKPSAEWVSPFKLQYLDLNSVHLGPQFPLWLQSQRNLLRLYISNTGILDTIPIWFPDISSRIFDLDLSNNQIHGEIQSLVKFVEFASTSIKLSHNNFSGPLPIISSNIGFLDFSNNSFSGSLLHFLCNGVVESNKLEYLNLGNNLLTGEIPDCWMKWRFLKGIKLGNNHLTGSIPNSMGYLTSLWSLHMRNNHLSGKLPASLGNCTELTTIDLSQNEFTGTIPKWLGRWSSSLVVLNLRSNKFRGNVPSELCQLISLHSLDLANNNLWGKIPRCFNNFSAMGKRENYDALTRYFTNKITRYFINGTIFFETAYLVTKGREFEYSETLYLFKSVDLSENNLSGDVPDELMSLLELISLNLSHNHLSGKIPNMIGDMRSVQSLDLSMNQLSGEIPSSMASLTFLSHLNLSYNNLTGRIPSSTQLQSLGELTFLGNKLCGPPLTKNCNEDGSPIPPSGNQGSEGDGFEVDFWFFVSIALGFVVGFWIVFGPLLFKKSWRIAYFHFLDSKWDKLCDFIFECRYIFNK